MSSRTKPSIQQLQNRIGGHGDADPKALVPNPRNWRKHPKAQADALSGVLSEVGWVQQVIVNQRTGRLVDGHLRVELALRRREPTVPVVYVDLSETEEAKVLATLDPLSAMAAPDTDALLALLQDATFQDGAVNAMLEGLANGETLPLR